MIYPDKANYCLFSMHHKPDILLSCPGTLYWQGWEEEREN